VNGTFNPHDDAMTAGGSEGISDTGSAGPVVGNAVVSALYVSSQLPPVRVSVQAGDSATMSDDVAVHQPTLFVPELDASQTGAGGGRNVSYPHPNNANAGR